MYQPAISCAFLRFCLTDGGGDCGGASRAVAWAAIVIPLNLWVLGRVRLGRVRKCRPLADVFPSSYQERESTFLCSLLLLLLMGSYSVSLRSMVLCGREFQESCLQQAFVEHVVGEHVALHEGSAPMEFVF